MLRWSHLSVQNPLSTQLNVVCPSNCGKVNVHFRWTPQGAQPAKANQVLKCVKQLKKARSQEKKFQVESLHKDLSTRQSQFLTWSRTNKGPINAVTSRIGGKSTGCECGEKFETMSHLLLDCPLYQERPTVLQWCSKIELSVLLQQKEACRRIVQFMSETSRFDI
ncbi:hypothetical protein MP228_011618 [Amoeboaphelidium protococcarum]|nr:hypothetical protein MP228_011618 [Amoeboaphelidium protococcarum]